MAYTEEQKKAVLDYYFSSGKGIENTVMKLGYPTRETLRNWVNADPRIRSRRQNRYNTRYPIHFKLEMVGLVLEEGLSPERACAMAGKPGPRSLDRWVEQYRKGGVSALMHVEDIRKAEDRAEKAEAPDDLEALKARNAELELENAVLRETVKVLKKGPCVDPKELSNKEKAAVIDALRDRFSLKALFGAMAVAPSSYHYSHAAAMRPDKYGKDRVRIREIYEESAGRYGALRIWQQLGSEGRAISEKVVRRLMRQEGLVVVNDKKRQRYNSYIGEVTPAPDNLVKRDFSAERPNEKWLTDMTEMVASDGKVYLSPVIDCFDGKVVAYTRGRHPDAELANTMLKDAASTLREGEHPIAHTDRGGPYRGLGWIALTEEYGLIRSMSKKGCSPDNAACEGFFGRMKNEMYHGFGWEKRTAAELMAAIDEYIYWYNTKRIKMSLSGMSIVEYRRSLGIAA